MYKTILWDVDATLLNFEKSEDVSLKQLFARYDVILDEEKMALYKKINRSYWNGLEQGIYDRHTVLTQRFDDFFDAIKHPRVNTDEMNDFYQLALGTNVFEENYVHETLQALETHYDQYVVSNGTHIAQIHKLEKSDLMKYMKDLFISEDLGYDKPSKEFFKQVQQATHYDPKTTLIVGDSLSSDMQGGRQAGITTIWYNPHHQKNNTSYVDYEIDDLRDVITIAKS
ncbi:MAG: YjjG family noncanonical pyrimidine nucleotidase [Intestinibaculum porci]|uniref:Noncanonical pyrimidine nucleotidase, YjjG family protein n=1 Tax=Intestinibaculum porci TaxID=2487118 RepID=A0A3G9J4X9_9FIRM|nr:YjjG family noncanonical pyrimidine nucleotidase [Intestinibaculum porci]MDD6422123.1 YjjG family noncanonical pyrimidine nucleotidase [Intestinibaculum porci]BBH26140.1 noncanonical pyrimidine nucleotidase, YjjG family protein [Intestinibaculum porci]